jgi:hypothetical protein
VIVLAQLLDDLETLETVDGAYLSSKLLAQGV